MPIIPTYTKQEFIKTPGTDGSVPSPVRQSAAYENDATRTAALLPQAARAVDNLGSFGGTGGAAVSVLADDDLHLRQTLLQELEQQLTQGTSINTSALEQAALKNFTPQTAESPAARDYTVLHRAAQEAQQAYTAVQARQAADTEKTLVRQVGALVRSPEVLDSYLSSQLPSYEARLRANGQTAEAVRAQAAQVRAQTVEENICRSLACGDWKSAEATLSKHGEHLGGSVRENCAAKTRALFARSQAEKLWEEARLKTAGPAEAVYQEAAALVQEPDLQLNKMMHHTLQAAARRQRAREHTLCAQTLAGAAGLSSADALRLLDAAAKAALFLDGDVTHTDAAQYVACYFTGTQKEHMRLLKREKISPRDYLRLEAARHRRQSGESFRAQELLCGGIRVWMQKKGFSAQDAQSAQYAVLAADVPSGSLGDVWKQIKNLLDV